MIFFPILLFSGLDLSKINTILLSMKSASRTLNFFNANSKIRITKELIFTTKENAYIILFSKKNVGDNQLNIVDSYQALHDNKKNIGAIYIRKERTQIVFVKERLENNDVSISSKYNNHIITEKQLQPF